MKQQLAKRLEETTPPEVSASYEAVRAHIAPNAMDWTRQTEAIFRQHNLGNWDCPHAEADPTPQTMSPARDEK